MTRPVLHVVFNLSAAIAVRKALNEAGRDDQVVALPDNLSFGPINPSDGDTRAQWVRAELGYSGWEDVGREVEAFWAASLSDKNNRIAWISRRSAHEYAGFLEFVWRLGDLPCRVIDLTEVMIARDNTGAPSSPRLVGSLSMMPAYQILEGGLLDRAEALAAVNRDTYRTAWRKLRQENAALRILHADLELISAPLSYFDQQLLSCATHDWLNAAKFVHEVFAAFSDDMRCQTDDLVLASRIRALVDAGRLQGKGDLAHLMSSEVRLSVSQA